MIKIPVYIVILHGEIDLVTSSYQEATKFVSDPSLDKWASIKFIIN